MRCPTTQTMCPCEVSTHVWSFSINDNLLSIKKSLTFLLFHTERHKAIAVLPTPQHQWKSQSFHIEKRIRLTFVHRYARFTNCFIQLQMKGSKISCTSASIVNLSEKCPLSVLSTVFPCLLPNGVCLRKIVVPTHPAMPQTHFPTHRN